MCGFSGQCADPRPLGVTYKGLNVPRIDPNWRRQLSLFKLAEPIPQRYVKGEFVGGCDIVREMFQAGELRRCSKDKGVLAKEGAQA